MVTGEPAEVGRDADEPITLGETRGVSAFPKTRHPRPKLSTTLGDMSTVLQLLFYVNQLVDFTISNINEVYIEIS